MSRHAVQVDGLGKEYIIGGAEQRHDSFREMLSGALLAPIRKLRKLGGAATEEERFWALKDISFNVEAGEVLGVIGRNGAGKSTLLKVLSRITSPTEGRVVTRGRVASLLEVGTGFHPELTGRENIYLNGAILGMSRAEIDRRFDTIVEFAEVEKFLDTPVKRYSSGMYVRLAFSVAAHLEPDIMLVDEVLAVGDASFQQKCLGKMQDVADLGRTVIFVSHNLGAIAKLCDRALLLERGALVQSGAVTEIIDEYFAHQDRKPSARSLAGDRDAPAKTMNFRLLGEGQQERRTFRFSEQFFAEVDLVQVDCGAEAVVALRVMNAMSEVVLTSWHTDSEDVPLSAERIVVEFPRQLLRPGHYRCVIMVLSFENRQPRVLAEVNKDFEVSDIGWPMNAGRVGVVTPILRWRQHD